MIQAKNSMGLIFFPAYDWAISPTHPEREERLLYTQDQVTEEGVFDIPEIIEYKPEIVTPQDLQRAHVCVPDEHSVTTESHLISAGGAKAIANAVMLKEVKNGFALVRPPGHHAMRVVHGARGFCNINIDLQAFIRNYRNNKCFWLRNLTNFTVSSNDNSIHRRNKNSFTDVRSLQFDISSSLFY